MSKLIELINKYLSYLNIRITNARSFKNAEIILNTVPELNLLKFVSHKHIKKYIDCMDLSKSQLQQDMFVLSELDFKNKGFFVEFGATNGIDLSNSYLLEREFHWTGILAEPARLWHTDLKKNRTANIETNCVWKISNSTLTFNETNDGEFSTLEKFSNFDGHQKSRKSGTLYDVKTISLSDLLKKYDAPSIIDYLSIDTEGSEYEILQSFDFDSYKFKVITCEHNFTSNRQKIYNLLTKNGYKRKLKEFSSFDDWYVLSNS